MDAITRIEEFIDHGGKADFLANGMLVSAVTYQLFIIGEASRHLAPGVEGRHPFIAWREMRGMRNVIAHEYGTVDPGVVWDVATTDLAPLRVALLAERDWLTSC
ncbi:HepT-like ribonuclease domain-containing protein [Paramagnetospirillum kuznetsovii]|uniref:HepT-like ribonuclease domain-containing protein n=1 Tax=Paramagnetospirillum kuznetsovii TaxID=2053833 RepID=UPI001EFCD2E1|nr:DUF86 domain-containing protein [Paramagnetospirillum kuznetsovii]